MDFNMGMCHSTPSEKKWRLDGYFKMENVNQWLFREAGP
jgi:hypothetical protein